MTVEPESTLSAHPSDAVSPQQPAEPIPMQPSFSPSVASNPVVQVPSNQPLVQPLSSYHIPPYSLNGSSHNVMFSEVVPRGIVDF